MGKHDNFDPAAFDLAHYEALKFAAEKRDCGYFVRVSLDASRFVVIYRPKKRRFPKGVGVFRIGAYK
jgi:hypothetical protein